MFSTFLWVFSKMRQKLAGDAIWKVIIFQAGTALILSSVALVFVEKRAALSILAGVAIIVASNLSYAWIARQSKVIAKPGGEVLLRHVLAQIAKLLVIFGLMLGAFTSNWFEGGWLVASMGAALLVHWVSLLLLR
jgi:hypothetical protein